jgi:hypothetical protein
LLSSVQRFFLRTAPSSTGCVHVKNGPRVQNEVSDVSLL